MLEYIHSTQKRDPRQTRLEYGMKLRHDVIFILEILYKSICF